MLRKIEQSDLGNIRSWRNQRHVREAMFTDHIISEKEHFQWWERVKSNDTQEWFIFLWGGIEAGVINFIDTDKKAASWGFYFSDQLKKGKQLIRAWEAMEREAIDHAFENYKMQTLIAKVFDFNRPVIRMHEKYGFTVFKSESREKNGISEKVLIMHLMRIDWKNNRKV